MQSPRYSSHYHLGSNRDTPSPFLQNKKLVLHTNTGITNKGRQLVTRRAEKRTGESLFLTRCRTFGNGQLGK